MPKFVRLSLDKSHVREQVAGKLFMQVVAAKLVGSKVFVDRTVHTDDPNFLESLAQQLDNGIQFTYQEMVEHTDHRRVHRVRDWHLVFRKPSHATQVFPDLVRWLRGILAPYVGTAEVQANHCAQVVLRDVSGEILCGRTVVPLPPFAGRIKHLE